ncbi:MAG: type III-B CRISPR module RAMP protein Cmr1 [Candidatus Cloacimonetes bacterium]|nr:type III-B CRISPR module RAMP protein Cmr1 [Candidatus Cloacimonadota bacterium]
MINVPIIFETITPLFTGNCNQEMDEIKPTSIMGSLRFWFEVICHFSGLFKYLKNDLDQKAFEKKVKENPAISDEEIQKELNLSPTAFYFGCTGWKSQIGIEKINPSEKDIRLIEPNKKKIVDGKNWHLPKKYYEGQFTIEFTLQDQSLKENILLPLLQFIQEYGFLGGKNNIGFGRVKILGFGLNNKRMNIFGNEVDYASSIQSKNLKESEMEKLNYFSTDKIEVLWLQEEPKKNYNHKNTQKNNDPFCSALEKYEEDNFDETDYKRKYTYFDSIKCLLLLKSKMRREIPNPPKRHFNFGSINKDNYFKDVNSKKPDTTGPNATKIIPLIREHERGFLAIPGIISMEETSNEKQ